MTSKILFHRFFRYRQFAGDHYGSHRQCVLSSVQMLPHLQTPLAAGVCLCTLEQWGISSCRKQWSSPVTFPRWQTPYVTWDTRSDFRSDVRRQMGQVVTYYHKFVRNSKTFVECARRIKESIAEPNSIFQTCRAENRHVQGELQAWESTITRASQNSVRVLTLWRLTTHIGGRTAPLTSKAAFYIFNQQI